MNIQRTHTSRKVSKLASAVCLAALFGTLALHYSNQELPSVAEATNLGDFNEMVGANHAFFFEGRGYTDKWLDIEAEDYIDFDLPNGVARNSIKSMQIGSAIRVLLCHNPGCQKLNEWNSAIELAGPYNIGQLIDKKEKWISQIRLWKYDPVNEPMVNLFREPRFDTGHAGLFPEGQYNTQAMLAHHVEGVSSISIPAGLYITIYKLDNFRGEEKSIEGPAQFDLYYDAEYKGWDNNVRSMYVFKIAALRVKCRWERVASVNGGPLKETVSVGWTSSSTKETEKTVTHSFSVAVQFGFSFAGFSSSTTMTTTQSQTVRNLVSDSLNQSKTVTKEFTCENPKGTRVALYQWKMTGVRDGQDSIDVQDSNYVCRYDANFNSGPKCPLGFCADNECNVCEGDFQPMDLAQ